MILPRFDISTGGLIPRDQLTQAIGAFILMDSFLGDGAARVNLEKDTGGILMEVFKDGVEDVYRFTHRGMEYRVTVMWGHNLGFNHPEVNRINFDFIREV